MIINSNHNGNGNGKLYLRVHIHSSFGHARSRAQPLAWPVDSVRGKATGPDGVVVMSSANGLVGTEFASRYRLQPRAGF